MSKSTKTIIILYIIFAPIAYFTQNSLVGHFIQLLAAYFAIRIFWVTYSPLLTIVAIILGYWAIKDTIKILF